MQTIVGIDRRQDRCRRYLGYYACCRDIQNAVCWITCGNTGSSQCACLCITCSIVTACGTCTNYCIIPADLLITTHCLIGSNSKCINKGLATCNAEVVASLG